MGHVHAVRGDDRRAASATPAPTCSWPWARSRGTDPDDGKTYEDEDDLALVDAGAEPVATITGTAADLDTWLWKRDPALTLGMDEGDRIRVEGDRVASRGSTRSWASRSTDLAAR